MYCRYCGSAVRSVEAVRLWDGLTYCEPCVEDAAPGLAEYCRQNIALVEKIPLIHNQVVWLAAIRHGCSFAAVSCGLCGVCFILDVSRAVLAVIVATIAAFFLTTLLIDRRLGYRWYIQTCPRTMVVKDGILYYLGATEVRKIRLTQCRWFIGTSWGTNDIFAVPNQRVVVLQLPDRNLVCGLSAETQDHWVGLLTLAGVRQRNLLRPARKGIAWVLGVLGGGCVAFVFAGLSFRYLMLILLCIVEVLLYLHVAKTARTNRDWRLMWFIVFALTGTGSHGGLVALGFVGQPHAFWTGAVAGMTCSIAVIYCAYRRGRNSREE